MPHTIVLGPFAFQVGVLVTFLALWAGWIAASSLARRRGLEIASELYLLLAIGVAGARLGFVARYSTAYLDAPLAILDIRDGGWAPGVGLLAVTLVAGALAIRRRSFALPLATAIGTSTALWVASTLGLTVLESPRPDLPPIIVLRLDGTSTSLDQFKGKPVVVNLWATWCPPCVREMPVLQQAKASRPDFHFVFLNQGEEAQKVLAFAARHQIATPGLLLDRSMAAGRLLGGRALPTTLFFDRHGRLVDTRVGELSSATLAQYLDALSP
jgi:thiol-disulfide isomerase/thioredoxin